MRNKIIAILFLPLLGSCYRKAFLNSNERRTKFLNQNSVLIKTNSVGLQKTEALHEQLINLIPNNDNLKRQVDSLKSVNSKF